MVYSNKFVMAVLLNGRPQKEKKNNLVQMPFGTEYSLRLRNKHSRRALVKIYIDGENVSGNGYIIDANDYVDIQRHHDIDRAFKFVPLDSEEAVDFGKNGDNDDKEKGLIEARFYLEKERKVSRPRQPWHPIRRDVHHHHHHTTEEHHHHHDVWPNLNNPYKPAKDFNGTWCDSREGGATYSSSSSKDYHTVEGEHPKMSAKASHDYKPTCDTGDLLHLKRISIPNEINITPPPINESEVLCDGCTVEGDETGQRFTTAWFDSETTYTVLKIFLQGHGEYESEYEEPSRPKKKRKTSKEKKIDDLESENEELRRKIAEMENKKLKEQLEQLES
jgi:hypothetical protein